MSTKKDEEKEVFPDALYECTRCGTRVTGRELSRLPSPTCANCGYRVFRKVGGRAAKNLKAE
jgi:DNA-directed RNA polymerase subunit RPC12/RpoP